MEGCAEFSRRIDPDEGYRIYRVDGPHLEAALRDAETVLGSDDPRVSRLLNGVAAALRSLGELARAKELLELALESDLRNLGEEHPTVATLRFNLAAVARDTGDLMRARELFTRTLAARERSLGADHPATSFTRASLAGMLYRLGETGPARAETERALWAVADQSEGSRFRTRVERAAARVLREP